MGASEPISARAIYGGKRAALRYWYFSTMARLGRFSPLRELDFERINRVVFICKGNICRSPYAERRARTLGLNAVSFGLNCSTGDPADPTAIRNADKRGVNLKPHRNAQLTLEAVGSSDLLVGMEPGHLTVLTRMGTGAQITLLGLWSRRQQPYIHDPYGLDDASFQACYDAIDECVSTLSACLSLPSEQLF